MKKQTENRIACMLFFLILVVLLYVVIEDNNLYKNMLKFEKLDFIENKVNAVAEEMDIRTNWLRERLPQQPRQPDYYNDSPMPYYFQIPPDSIRPDGEYYLEP